MVRVTVLGCGASSGVPVVGCDCRVCCGGDALNQRSRVSVLFEVGSEPTRLLVDSSPDLRQQALRHGLKTVDAILYTHDHADHTHGIDDVRPFNYHRQSAIPIWAAEETLAVLRERFGYVFRPPKPEFGWFSPSLIPHAIPEPLAPFDAAGVRVIPFWQQHGRARTLGFRVGDIAYSTDVKTLDDDAFRVLDGVKIWIVDCLKETESWSHSHLSQTLAWVERLKPERAILTHMSHELDYHQLRQILPKGVEPGFDGMVVEA